MSAPDSSKQDKLPSALLQSNESLVNKRREINASSIAELSSAERQRAFSCLSNFFRDGRDDEKRESDRSRSPLRGNMDRSEAATSKIYRPNAHLLISGRTSQPDEHSEVFLQPSVATVHFRIPVDWKNVSIKLEGVVLDTDASMLPVEGQLRLSPKSR